MLANNRRWSSRIRPRSNSDKTKMPKLRLNQTNIMRGPQSEQSAPNSQMPLVESSPPSLQTPLNARLIPEGVAHVSVQRIASRSPQSSQSVPYGQRTRLPPSDPEPPSVHTPLSMGFLTLQVLEQMGGTEGAAATKRGPQSLQSWPSWHRLASAPAPPSWQTPLLVMSTGPEIESLLQSFSHTVVWVAGPALSSHTTVMYVAAEESHRPPTSAQVTPMSL